MRLKVRRFGLRLYCRRILLVPLLEIHVGGFVATNQCAFHKSSSRGTGIAHIHVCVRLAVDPKDWKICTESAVTLATDIEYGTHTVRTTARSCFFRSVVSLIKNQELQYLTHKL